MAGRQILALHTPSRRRHVFRALTKLLAVSRDSITSIPKLRAFSSFGPKKPLLPRGTALRAETADGVPVEWIAPDGPASASVVLYLHGGGWTLGWYNSHRWLLGQICLAAASRALAVDYRLAPEHPFPAALEDCLTVYRWLVKQGTPPRNIVIAGDSAGANLTLATLMSLRDAGDPLPAAAVCISAMTDLEGTGETFRTRTDPLLSADFALDMARYYVGDQDPRLPLISPIHGNLRGLPPLLVHVGEDEILLSDATRLADAARAAGVEVNLVIWPKMWHVWHVFAPYLPEARQAVEAIGRFIREKVFISYQTPAPASRNTAAPPSLHPLAP